MATHASRRTDLTGKAFENLCYDLLDSAGYNVEEQVNLGLRSHRWCSQRRPGCHH